MALSYLSDVIRPEPFLQVTGSSAVETVAAAILVIEYEAWRTQSRSTNSLSETTAELKAQNTGKILIEAMAQKLVSGPLKATDTKG